MDGIGEGDIDIIKAPIVIDNVSQNNNLLIHHVYLGIGTHESRNRWWARTIPCFQLLVSNFLNEMKPNRLIAVILLKYHLWSDLTINIDFNSVGRPIYQKVMITQNDDEVFIGDAAEKYKGILKLNYPIEHGVI